MWIAIAAQALTCLIALGLLWKDWEDLKGKARYLPAFVLLGTVALTILSIVLVVKVDHEAKRQQADAERTEAGHKGEALQFQQTLNTLLDRIGLLQKQVNTEPLLQQNQKLQQDLSDTKKLVQSTKDQLGKPAPKATLQATFARMPQQVGREQETTSRRESDGSVEFSVMVVNTSNVRAKGVAIYLEICTGCTFAKEPERFTTPVGAGPQQRQLNFGDLDAGTAAAIPLKISAPTALNWFQVSVTSRCENCEMRTKDDLLVHF